MTVTIAQSSALSYCLQGTGAFSTLHLPKTTKTEPILVGVRRLARRFRTHGVGETLATQYPSCAVVLVLVECGDKLKP